MEEPEHLAESHEDVEPRAKNDALRVRLSHPDRILYPEQGITKRALVDYYLQVAEWMMPHLANRILTLVRCPEGRHKECFFQKHVGRGTAEHIDRVPIREKGKTVSYMAVKDVAGLVALVQMGTLEIHTWGARADRPERPDQLVFDLDPAPDVKWEQVIEGALTARDYLHDLGLESFLKTSGGKGLHVVVPVERRVDWDTTKVFCKGVAVALSQAQPKKYLATMSKAKRQGRVFIDYLRNGRGATSICAFSARARPGAPVSTPVDWKELSAELRPDQFSIDNLPERLRGLTRDPWEGFFDLRQSITKKMQQSVTG